MKKYYDELNVFRALIIIWVTLGHCIDSANGIFAFLHTYAYTFHMQAFFMLSGLLFAGKIKASLDFKSKCKMIADRTKRLFVPYLFYTFLSYALKSVFSSFAYNDNSTNIIKTIFVCDDNPNGGLWFLYTLFIMNIIAVLLSNITVTGLLILSATLKIMSVFYIPHTAILIFVVKYSVYFFIGAALNSVYDKISDKILSFCNRKKTFTALLALALLCISALLASLKGKLTLNENIFEFIVALFNIFSWYVTAVNLNGLKLLKKSLMTVGNYSMDIYMLGYYVQIALRVILKSVLSLPAFVYSPAMFIFGLLLPIPISKYIIRKFSITNAVMLGNFPKKGRGKK